MSLVIGLIESKKSYVPLKSFSSFYLLSHSVGDSGGESRKNVSQLIGIHNLSKQAAINTVEIPERTSVHDHDQHTTASQCRWVGCVDDTKPPGEL